MSDSAFSRRKQQLLDKFLAGEIDKSTYDGFLADLQELGSQPSTSLPSDNAGSKPSSFPSISITESRSSAERSALSQPVALLEPGTELGGFELRRRLSRGGMGEVWLAHDPTGERMVVIKVLPPELQRSPDEMARVKQTFNRVHNLQHQHICPVYLLGQDPRFGYFIVMKYIDGVNLAAHRKAYVQQRGSFPLREVLRLLSPIASALDYAHGRQIIHRDVKPQNIMLSADGQDVQLVDFGLAAEVRTSLMRVSQVQMETCGTYPYMAPEQWQGQLQDARTDQYSLAVVVFEMITGRLPFESTDPAVLRMCVLSDPPPPISSAPASINAVIAKAMAKSREDRFESCIALLKALAKAASEQTSKPADQGSTPPGSETRSTSTASARPPQSSAMPEVLVTESKKETKPSALSSDRPASKAVPKESSLTSPSKGTISSPKSQGLSPSSKPPAQKRPRLDVLEEVDELEIVEDDDDIIEDDDDRPARSRRKPKAKPRVQTESALKKANARAMLWISIFGGTACVAVLVGAVWFIWSGVKYLTAPGTSPSNAPQIVSGDPQTVPSAIMSSNPSAVAAVPNPGSSQPAARPNEKASLPLRYGWEVGKSYVYSVNVELEPENDVILSMTGNSTYTRGQPVARKSDEPGSGKGTGTGFVIQPNGYLLTCHHVVDDASDIEVVVGGKKYPATVVTEDVEHDLALIKIEAAGLATLALSDSDKVQVGEEVRAIGFPFSSILGDNIKATRGTISGINQEEDRKVLQVDAGINPGNSGGPLVNERGDVVGVNFAKLREEMATNVGFAVPINDAVVLLQGQGIDFTRGTDRGSKLEGPELVKKVATATALITVTTGGGAGAGLHHFELRCNGSFTTSARSKSGQTLDPNLSANLQRQHLRTNFGRGGSEPDVVETDALGRFHDITGARPSLPAFLGPLSKLMLEQLPSTRRPTWTHAFPVIVVFSEQSGESLGMPHRFRPRFRPPGFPGFPGNSKPVTKTTEVPGRIRIVYTVQDTVGDLLKIKKDFELDARENSAKDPRVHLKGTGVLQFDLKAGVPRSFEYAAILVENESNKTTKLPIKLTYSLQDGQGGPVPLAQAVPAVQEAAVAPVKPVENEVAPAEVSQKLTQAEINQCLDDLKGTHAGKANQAASKLQKAIPLEESRDHVLAALERLLKDKDTFKRKQAIDAMATWAKPETVPVLIRCLDENAMLVKLAAIDALGKLKDERAIEPLSKLITVPGPRVQAAKALQSLGSKSEGVVAQLLKHSDADVRSEACRLLKEIGTAASESALQEASQDSDRTVSKLAKDALSEVSRRK